MGSWELFCRGWPRTMIFLSSTFHVARMTGMSHWCPVQITCFAYSFLCNSEVTSVIPGCWGRQVVWES
jgi:hypothetical protein